MFLDQQKRNGDDNRNDPDDLHDNRSSLLCDADMQGKHDGHKPVARDGGQSKHAARQTSHYREVNKLNKYNNNKAKLPLKNKYFGNFNCLSS